MDNKVLNLTYASSLTNLCEINSSFDCGILKIAYTNENRNGSSISKEAFERSLKTIYNCPIVCNYNRETDTLGGHDIEIVKKDDGSLNLVNVTTPVGCIPESAKVFWEEVDEDDGTTHEYLCAEALLWKRQEAYKKIKEDGITSQSMEITVKEGKTVDGVFVIKDFEFTAFTLIGVEPCFESASLEVFSKNNFKQQFSEMMLELKESFKSDFNLVNAFKKDDNINSKNNSTEGGRKVLDKNELIAKYGIDINALDFSIDDFTVEELEEKFKTMNNDDAESEGEGAGGEPANEPSAEHDDDKAFALTSAIIDELVRALGEEKVQKDWGEYYERYWYVDCDFDVKEVYCWDCTDWILYGFNFEMNGDNAVVDFDSKKRKKYVVADFDEGEQKSPLASVFNKLEQKLNDNAGLETKLEEASNTITAMESELKTLREFKRFAEEAEVQNERAQIFAKFEDLNGMEDFEALKENCENYELEALEEKCYAIRGRHNVPSKFSLETKIPKLKVTKEENKQEPYGGIFEEYGFSENN